MRILTYEYIYDPDPVSIDGTQLLIIRQATRYRRRVAIAPPGKSILDAYRQMIESVPLDHSFIAPIYYPVRGRFPWVSLGIRGKAKRNEQPHDSIAREGFEEFGYIPLGFRQSQTIVDHSPRKTTYIYRSTAEQVGIPDVMSGSSALLNREGDDYSRRVIWLVHGTIEQLRTIAEQPRLLPCGNELEQIIGYALISRANLQRIIDDFRVMHERRHVGLIAC